MDVLVRSDGSATQVVLALSYPIWAPASDRICWARTAAARDGYAAFDVYWAVGASVASARDTIFYASIDQISTVETPIHTIDESGLEAIKSLDVGARGVIWELDPNGQTQGIIDGVFFDISTDAQGPVLIGADVLTTSWVGPLHLRTGDGTNRNLYDISPRSFAGTAMTDGTSIVWFDRTDPTTSVGLALRASPFADTAAAFAPRVLEVPPAYPQMQAIGDGLVAYNDFIAASGGGPDIRGLRVLDVTTGSVRRFTNPDGEFVSWLYAVSTDEMIFETTTATGRALYFVDPSSLPTLP